MALRIIQGVEEAEQGIRYEVDLDAGPIGVGGMGAVYKGVRVNENNNVRSEVAIKFLFADLPEHVIDRARREASVRINHENLVEMLGFITVDEEISPGRIQSRYHVVSEFLRGVMLHDLLNGKVTDQYDVEIPYARELYGLYQNNRYQFAVNVIKSILSGILTLHDNGYIHRDLDPSNIMITCEGKIKILDFGIAKKLSSLTTQDKQLTTAGHFMGKASYAAPELVTGDIAHQDATTDIYAVGIMLFQFIAGRLPFEGSTHEVLNMQLHDNLPMSLISNSSLKKIIAKATSKKQANRFQSAAEFRVAMERFVPDEPDSLVAVLMKKVSSAIKGVSLPSGWTGRKIIYASAAFAAAACLAGIIFTVANREPEPVGPDPYIEKRLDSLKNVFVDSYDRNITLTDHITEYVIVSVGAKVHEAEQMLLSDSLRVLEGVRLLDTLANRNYKASAEAAYLLGQYYMKTIENDASHGNETMIDSLAVRSHAMNLRAMELDSTFYKGIYELGSDYFAGDVRTGIEDSRDLGKAYKLSELGLRHATIANDTVYMVKFASRIKTLKKYI